MFDSLKSGNRKRLRKKMHNSGTDNILREDSEFVVNEAYKATRTNIMFSFHDREGCKTIVCTSAMPGEGKTTTCINVAISFAQTGAKVLLIDADLRKPKVGRYLHVGEGDGLSDFLGGFVKNSDDIIKTVEEKSMDCITSGSVPPNPAELLGSNAMHIMLKQLQDRYDYIFIDAPPVNVVTDAIVLAKDCIGTIVVVKENNTTHDMLKNALGAIKFANIRVLGLIVNGSEVKRGGKYRRNKKSYGGYGSYGSYGYGGYDYDYGYGYGYESHSKHNQKADTFGEQNVVEENVASKKENSKIDDMIYMTQVNIEKAKVETEEDSADVQMIMNDLKADDAVLFEISNRKNK